MQEQGHLDRYHHDRCHKDTNPEWKMSHDSHSKSGSGGVGGAGTVCLPPHATPPPPPNMAKPPNPQWVGCSRLKPRMSLDSPMPWPCNLPLESLYATTPVLISNPTANGPNEISAVTVSPAKTRGG